MTNAAVKSTQLYLPRSQSLKYAYAEMLIPIISRASRQFLPVVDLQTSVRRDSYLTRIFSPAPVQVVPGFQRPPTSVVMASVGMPVRCSCRALASMSTAWAPMR